MSPRWGVAHWAKKCLAHTMTRIDFTVARPVGEGIEALAAARKDGSPAPAK